MQNPTHLIHVGIYVAMLLTGDATNIYMYTHTNIMLHEEYRETMFSNSIRPAITRFSALFMYCTSVYTCSIACEQSISSSSNSLCYYMCINIIEKMTYRSLNVDETMSITQTKLPSAVMYHTCYMVDCSCMVALLVWQQP